MLSHTVLKRMEQLPKLSIAGKRVNGLFNLMKCDLLWEQAYERIARNQGSLTPGVDGETFDGFSPERLHRLMSQVFSGTYHPNPVRRVYIPKANGKLRPLGIPTVNDRLVQEVVRSILERIYEPVFSEHSHGFRPGRSCHTALDAVRGVWTGVKWLVEVDVVGFFDNIDHEVLLKLLAKRIDDDKFIGLVRGMLKAGYLEDWHVRETFSGTPQGGIVSPLLANVYLHELDEFMEGYRQRFDKGDQRSVPAEYWRLNANMQYRWKKVRRLRSEGKADDPELPPSEWSIDYDSLDQGRDDECLRRSTSPRRLSGSCVRLRSCWARAGRRLRRAGGSRSASRPITAGARNMVA